MRIKEGRANISEWHRATGIPYTTLYYWILSGRVTLEGPPTKKEISQLQAYWQRNRKGAIE